MMDDMGGPKETDPMGDIVRPITAEIKKDIAGDKCPPVKRHTPGQQVIDPYKNDKQERLQQEADKDISNSNEDRTDGFLFIIVLFVS
jgi:hypothetical protein